LSQAGLSQRNFASTPAQRKLFVENGGKSGSGKDPLPCLKIFAIFMFDTSKSNVFKSLHKEKDNR
jgi:hypothetical protein